MFFIVNYIFKILYLTPRGTSSKLLIENDDVANDFFSFLFVSIYTQNFSVNYTKINIDKSTMLVFFVSDLNDIRPKGIIEMYVEL